MAQIPATLYVSIAEAFDASRRNITQADDDLLVAVNAIVDVTTSTSGAVALELALLGPVNTAQTSLSNSVSSTTTMLSAVRAINDYVINNDTTGGATPLTTFVNDTAVWTRGEAPYHWFLLSTDAGFDTSSWIAETS